MRTRIFDDSILDIPEGSVGRGCGQVSLSNELFKDFNDVEEIATTDTYKYVVGSANSYKEALEYSKWVKSRYPDAFIVAVSQGKIVPLSDALEKTKD